MIKVAKYMSISGNITRHFYKFDYCKIYIFARSTTIKCGIKCLFC